jgi:hypothetical protein
VWWMLSRERTATTFLEALHESEGRRSCLKHCQLRRAAIERSLMEQAETLVRHPSLHPSPRIPTWRTVWFVTMRGSWRTGPPACATGPVVGLGFERPL